MRSKFKDLPFKCNICKRAVVLATVEVQLLFVEKYRVLMRGFGNMDKEYRYTIYSDNLNDVIQYMQERCNALAKRRKPERIEVYIFKDKIDFNSYSNRFIYHWEYKPTYRG